MFYPVSKIKAIRWQCPECSGVLEIPLAFDQKLNIYSSRGQWHCPVCQKGDSTIKDDMNEFIHDIKTTKDKKHNISLIFDVE